MRSKNIVAFAVVWIFAICSPVGAQQGKKVKLYGQINEVLYACSSAGITLDSDKLPTLVNRVRLGSSAAYAGVMDDDQILAGTIGDGTLQLLIRRGEKRYSVSLKTAPAPTNAKISSERLNGKLDKNKDDGATKQTLLKGQATEAERLKKLAQHDIYIFVDCSDSMNAFLSNSNKSKWEWCEQQLERFSEKLTPYLHGRGISLVTFNGTYKLEANCSTEKIEQLFRRRRPEGSTNLGNPLAYVFDKYFEGNKEHPLLVAVLTDGLPNEGKEVDKVIIDATRKMLRPDEVKVAFFEIGEEFEGRAFLNELLNKDIFYYYGAAYDIVDTKTFDQLQRTGLANALISAVDVKQISADEHGKTSLQDDLADVKRKLAKPRP